MPQTSRPFAPAQWLAIAATLIAALLAVIAIDRPSLWVDERISLNISQVNTPAEVVTNVIASERRPPAWHVGLWAWSVLLGPGEAVARLYSVMWMVALVPAVFQLARAFTSGRGAALAALFAATSPVMIGYGQTIRYYAFVATLAALSFAAFFRLMRTPGRPWGVYLASTALLLLSDYPAYGVPLAQAAIGLLWWRNTRAAPHHPRARWLIALAGLAVPVIAWVPVIIEQRTRDFGAAELSGGILGVALRLAYSGYAWLVGETLFPWSPLAILGLIVCAGLTAFGWTRLAPRAGRTSWLIAFCIPLLAAQVLLATVATDAPFVNAPPRTMACFGLICVLVGAGLAGIRRQAVLAAAVGVIVLTHAAALLNYYRGVDFINTVYNTPAREVARAIVARAAPGDAVVGEDDSVVETYLPEAQRAAYFDVGAAGALGSYLSAHPGARVWQVEMGRDRTRNMAAEALRQSLLSAPQNRAVVSDVGFGVQDERYRALKARLLGREVYVNRLTLFEIAPK